MLQAINDRIKGWLGIVIVVLIGLPFALWGIQSYFDDSGPRYIAKINDIEISANEFERAVSRQRQEMLRQNNGELLISETAVREQTLNQIINQKLLEDYSYQNDYRISNSVLSERIKQLFTNDGVFDRERFEMIVASNGMTLPMYEESLRSELRVQQVQSAITRTAFVTDSEVKNLAAINDQTRDIDVLTFNIEGFSTSTEVSAEDIKAYYESNKQRFMVPEKIKIDYVEITSDSLGSQVKVDEQQIKAMYDQYVASITGRQQRKASHILIQDKDADARARLEDVREKLDQGADFAAMAKEFSEDSGSANEGGDLGWVSPGEMVKPFEQALFDMERGSVSDIVETQFGYHIIKLDDIRSEEVQPLGIKRYEFEDELKADQVASLFYDQSERLAALAFENPDNLDVAVEKLGLEIKTSGYFGRTEGDGIAENEKLRNVAFSSAVLEQGINSDIIEISPTDIVVLRLNEYVPATPIPLETVSSRIENILKAQDAHKQTMAAAQQVKSKLESGESVDSVKTDGVSVDTYTGLRRTDSAKVSDPSILYNAFEMSINDGEKQAIKAVDLITGDVALVVLKEISNAEEVPENVVKMVRSEVLRETAIREFSSTLSSIENSADIKKYLRDRE